METQEKPGPAEQAITTESNSNKKRAVNAINPKLVIGLFLIAISIISGTITAVWVTRNDGSETGSSSSSSNTSLQEGAPTPLRATPSLTPSNAPSSAPSVAPSTAPSAAPSMAPSVSGAPSLVPSDVPTVVVSQAPTQEIVEYRVPANPVPSNPPSSYFNYDISDSEHGPERWHRVNTNTRDNYLREFGPSGFGPFRGHFDRDPTENRCDRRGAMSPLDLYQTDRREAKCDAHHQIRTRVRTIYAYPLVTRTGACNALHVSMNAAELVMPLVQRPTSLLLSLFFLGYFHILYTEW